MLVIAQNWLFPKKFVLWLRNNLWGFVVGLGAGMSGSFGLIVVQLLFYLFRKYFFGDKRGCILPSTRFNGSAILILEIDIVFITHLSTVSSQMGFNGEKTLYKNISKDKRALSPVIATVILISVTIVVAVSVAYWMGAIAGGNTSFEQIELPSIYAEVITTPSAGWNITIDLKNTGSAAATVDNIYINSMPLDDFPTGDIILYGPDGAPVTLSSISVSVANGNTETIVLQLKESTTDGFTAGTRIEVKIHTAAGKDYPTSVRLP